MPGAVILGSASITVIALFIVVASAGIEISRWICRRHFSIEQFVRAGIVSFTASIPIAWLLAAILMFSASPDTVAALFDDWEKAIGLIWKTTVTHVAPAFFSGPLVALFYGITIGDKRRDYMQWFRKTRKKIKF